VALGAVAVIGQREVQAAGQRLVSGSVQVKSAYRRDETIVRLGGCGDDFVMSWAADGRQFVAVQDGAGWLKSPECEYNSRLWAMRGDPNSAQFEEVPGFPELLNEWHTRNIARYYGFGTLALNEGIYQFLSTPAGPVDSDFVGWIGAKLIYSLDNGRTWRNQDGTTPVVWEPWGERSRANMAFFREPQNAFSLLAILQMGRNYEANRDGYVYVYAPNGLTDGAMNQLVMFRVLKQRIRDRASYEYFAGRQADGEPLWSRDIAARAPVHTFARGWVNSGPFIVESWYPSIVYNAPLGLYLMANWGVGCAADGSPWGKPSYLGFWTASNPWGAWQQIHEEFSWTPAGDIAARCYVPQIAPKWIGSDGMSFWLVWTDYQQKHTPECREFQKAQADFLNPKGKRHIDRHAAVRYMRQACRCAPYYSFNTQRIDLETT
jgi:hypothetical protein